MKRFSRILLCTIVFSLLVGLVGCAPEAPKTTPKAPEAPKITEVKVGVVLPLSGNIAQTGNLVKQAMELAADVVNNKYPDLNLPCAATEGFPNFGGAKLKLVFLDSQNTPEKGMSAVEQLITQEKVHAVMGAYSSAVTQTASQAAEKLGIPFLNENSTSPGLTTRGFQWFWRCT
ncbi:MAG: ABC transporter substrate-binding protein, partial [Bacillota bacterium]|nr:ABC transporter substrate-binding protein [Bacillota bacterium]